MLSPTAMQFLRSHRPQLSWRRSPSCHCCCDTQASSGLEKARRETQSHLVTFGGGRPETSEHWSFFCLEKSFWAGGLAPHRGHGRVRHKKKKTAMRSCNSNLNHFFNLWLFVLKFAHRLNPLLLLSEKFVPIWVYSWILFSY